MFRLNNKKHLFIFLLLLVFGLICIYLLLLSYKNTQLMAKLDNSKSSIKANAQDSLDVPQNTKNENSKSLTNSTHTPTPTPTPKIETLTQMSPEGKLELILKTKEVSPDQIHYSLFIKQRDTNQDKKIFDDVINNQIIMTIPFNTWSPDNKYFFVKQEYKDSKKFLVFKSSGEMFADEPYLDVTKFYVEKEIPYELEDITGWASPTLLLVNTNSISNDTITKISYWFDIPSKTFIRLSTKF